MSGFEKQRIRALEAFTRVAKKLAHDSKRPKHLEVGYQGEEAGFFYLRHLGFTVVARRWRSAKLRGDLDLIAWEGDILCFIEVKTRSSREVATAEAAVDEEKCKMLRRMARQYLRGLKEAPLQVRFDILSVYPLAGAKAECHLFRSVFGWY